MPNKYQKKPVIAHAPEDIRALLDEVTDLRMKLEAAQFQIEKVKALHFPADLESREKEQTMSWPEAIVMVAFFAMCTIGIWRGTK